MELSIASIAFLETRIPEKEFVETEREENRRECSVLEKVVIERQEKMTTTTRYSEAFKRKVIQS
ncbi:hypothetical protein QMM53_18105, partial [Leptospira santarosai]|nr:hypothetical protein [Leptospira santarosai]